MNKKYIVGLLILFSLIFFIDDKDESDFAHLPKWQQRFPDFFIEQGFEPSDLTQLSFNFSR